MSFENLNYSTANMDNESIQDQVDAKQLEISDLTQNSLKELKVDIQDSHSFLQLRDENGNTIGRVKDNETLTFLGATKTVSSPHGEKLFLCVKTANGGTGYVSADYLKGKVEKEKITVVTAASNQASENQASAAEVATGTTTGANENAAQAEVVVEQNNPSDEVVNPNSHDSSEENNKPNDTIELNDEQILEKINSQFEAFKDCIDQINTLFDTESSQEKRDNKALLESNHNTLIALLKTVEGNTKFNNKVAEIELYLAEYYADEGNIENSNHTNYKLSNDLAFNVLTSHPEISKPPVAPNMSNILNNLKGTGVGTYIISELGEGKSVNEVFSSTIVQNKTEEEGKKLSNKYENDLKEYLENIDANRNQLKLNPNQSKALDLLMDVNGAGWFNVKNSTTDMWNVFGWDFAAIGAGIGTGLVTGSAVGSAVPLAGTVIGGIVGALSGGIVATGGMMLNHGDNYFNSEDMGKGFTELGINTFMFGAGGFIMKTGNMLRGAHSLNSVRGYATLSGEVIADVQIGAVSDYARAWAYDMDIKYSDAVINNLVWALLPFATIPGAHAIQKFSNARKQLANEAAEVQQKATILSKLGEKLKAEKLVNAFNEKVNKTKEKLGKNKNQAEGAKTENQSNPGSTAETNTSGKNNTETQYTDEVIGDIDYKIFKENGKVSDDILESIIKKNNNGTPLSKYETEIFDSNISKSYSEAKIKQQNAQKEMQKKRDQIESASQKSTKKYEKDIKKANDEVSKIQGELETMQSQITTKEKQIAEAQINVENYTPKLNAIINAKKELEQVTNRLRNDEDLPASLEDKQLYGLGAKAKNGDVIVKLEENLKKLIQQEKQSYQNATLTPLINEFDSLKGQYSILEGQKALAESKLVDIQSQHLSKMEGYEKQRSNVEQEYQQKQAEIKQEQQKKDAENQAAQSSVPETNLSGNEVYLDTDTGKHYYKKGDKFVDDTGKTADIKEEQLRIIDLSITPDERVVKNEIIRLLSKDEPVRIGNKKITKNGEKYQIEGDNRLYSPNDLVKKFTPDQKRVFLQDQAASAKRSLDPEKVIKLKDGNFIFGKYQVSEKQIIVKEKGGDRVLKKDEEADFYRKHGAQLMKEIHGYDMLKEIGNLFKKLENPAFRNAYEKVAKENGWIDKNITLAGNFLKTQINPFRIIKEVKDADGFRETTKALLFGSKNISWKGGIAQTTIVGGYSYFELLGNNPESSNNLTPELYADTLGNHFTYAYMPILWAVIIESIED